MTYEDFCTEAEVATYKRVKRRAMRLGGVSREVAARMVGGRVTGRGDEREDAGFGKRFVRTSVGLYRMSLGPNSDNSTEQAAHERMGATRIVMGDRDEMTSWFAAHGLPGDAAYDLFISTVAAEL